MRNALKELKTGKMLRLNNCSYTFSKVLFLYVINCKAYKKLINSNYLYSGYSLKPTIRHSALGIMPN